MPRNVGIHIINMKGYSTAQVAKAVGVSKNTILRWLYAGTLKEPEHQKVGGMTWRIWSEADIERARKVKATIKRGRKVKAKGTDK
jgi:excisionase family DNA binding protein